MNIILQKWRFLNATVPCVPKQIRKLYEFGLGIIVDRKGGMPESWFLITNDTASSRDEIIACYYHRFEIEEFFRDAKRLLDLEWVTWKSEASIAATLWFVILGIWCLRHITDGMDDLMKAARGKMRLSESRTCSKRSNQRRFKLPKVNMYILTIHEKKCGHFSIANVGLFLFS